MASDLDNNPGGVGESSPQSGPGNPPGGGLLGLSAEGAAIRRAVGALDRFAPLMGPSIRRAIPFLTRRGVKFTHAPSWGGTRLDIETALEGPLFVAELETEGGARGLLILDAGVIVYLIEGILGGDGSKPPSLNPESLSPPQRALMSRMADQMLAGLLETIHAELGVRLRRSASTATEVAADTLLAAARVQLGPEEEAERRIVIALQKEALFGDDVAGTDGTGIDPRVASAVENVELELIAELGRTRITLGDLTNLQVGDTLRLTVPVNGAVLVRAGGQVLMEGYPTTSGSQIAIRVAKTRADGPVGVGTVGTAG
jgi:flagellar motor switch/type III secretory pathway protein FliN